MIRVIFLSIVFILMWFVSNFGYNWSKIEWVNMSFFVGLISFMALAIIYIIKSELFNLFFKGFKLIGQMIYPKSRAMQRVDEMMGKNEGSPLIDAKYQIIFFQTLLSIAISSMIISMYALINL
ncbi:DUF3899 domain-containing protein [Solibacillus cecembensis]|uniref:DUF3899 domain-containing protein n=1 Tax=Solibacillus cecembensis TaxID=459347 RepID=UPI0007174A4F